MFRFWHLEPDCHLDCSRVGDVAGLGDLKAETRSSPWPPLCFPAPASLFSRLRSWSTSVHSNARPLRKGSTVRAFLEVFPLQPSIAFLGDFEWLGLAAMLCGLELPMLPTIDGDGIPYSWVNRSLFSS